MRPHSPGRVALASLKKWHFDVGSCPHCYTQLIARVKFFFLERTKKKILDWFYIAPDNG
jgi:hypothetical protein